MKLKWPLITRRRHDAEVAEWADATDALDDVIRKLNARLDMTAQREISAAVNHQQADADRRKTKRLKRQAEKALTEARRHGQRN